MSRRKHGPAGTLRRAAPLFAALGDQTRLRLMIRLSEREPLSITELASGTDITRQAVTKHLRVLADAGLVRGVREGRESSWELQPERLDEARRGLDLIARQWDVALARLKALVEETDG